MSPTDSLADDPFSFQVIKDDKVVIRYKGRSAMTLRGKEGARFLSKIEGQESRQQQLVMAKLTGQFKMGNERLGKLAKK